MADWNEIENLISRLKRYPFDKMEIEAEGFSMKFAMGNRPLYNENHGCFEGLPFSPSPLPNHPENLQELPNEKRPQEGEKIKSPQIGFFFFQPPGQAPDPSKFLKPGDAIQKGHRIGFIKTLERYQEIKASKDGTIQKVLKKNGDSVEYGEVILEWIGEGN